MVAEERRMEARLKFHCDATAMGISGIQTITNISLGGFYLKGDIPDRIDTGQTKTINVKLPSEKYVTRLKAKVVRQTIKVSAVSWQIRMDVKGPLYSNLSNSIIFITILISIP